MQKYLYNLEPVIWASEKYATNKRVISPSIIKAANILAYMSYGENIDMPDSYMDTQYYTDGEKGSASQRESYIKQIIKLAKDDSTIKMLISIKKESKYVVCVAIAGSGADINDWKDNMQLDIENDAHKGFLKNANDVVDTFKDIAFPSLAKDIGAEKITLYDIIQECAMPRSRFCLFFTGHSKGAAIVQLVNHLLIDNYYVDRKNMFSICFASPSVVSYKFINTTYKYPIVNIQNKDDIVTRYGAKMHLGVLIEFQPSASIYRFSNDVFNMILDIVHKLPNNENSVLLLYALIQYLIEHDKKDEDISMLSHILLPRRLLGVYSKTIEKYYIKSSGHDIDNRIIKSIIQSITKTFETCTNIRDISKLVYAYGRITHKLYKKNSPYVSFIENPKNYDVYIYDRLNRKRKSPSFIRISDNKNLIIRTSSLKQKNRGIYEKRIKHNYK